MSHVRRLRQAVRVLRVVPQVLCIVIGCCYFIARRRNDMKVPVHRKSHFDTCAVAADAVTRGKL
jgi:uncharacterized membrane protein